MLLLSLHLHSNSEESEICVSEEKITELESKLVEALSTFNEQEVELEKAKEGDLQWQQQLNDAKVELEQ